MKTQKLLAITAISMALFILTSCGIMRNDDFSSRKYTHFKKGETAININKAKEERKEIQTSSSESLIKTDGDIDSQPAITIVTKQEPSSIKVKSNTENKIVACQNKQVTTAPNKLVRIKRNAALLAKYFEHKANTTSVNTNDADLLMLIIAILLPPLAVYLVAGIGNEFWIDIILCILFWLPGIIYAVLVVLGEVS